MTSPFTPLLSIISPIEKGLLKASRIPARKFSPISLKAKPTIKVNIPAPAKIFERLLAITKESQTMGADFPPTSQQKLVYQELNTQLEKLSRAYLKL